MRSFEELTPAQFEEHVESWLSSAGEGATDFRVTRLEHVEGSGGEYEIDVVARLTILGGAEVVVLVECKHHKNSIKRDVLMVLESKLRDTKANKAMLFSTSDFQSGALEFAKVHGIATIRVTDSSMALLTRSVTGITQRDKGDAVGWLCTPAGKGVDMKRIDAEETKPLQTWLMNG